VAAAAAGGSAAAAGSDGVMSQYPATCHRLVVLECKPSQPRKLLVSGRASFVGVQAVSLYFFYTCRGRGGAHR
jgi:hypothetical protein